jgi:zinc transport system substrate-binding protein
VIATVTLLAAACSGGEPRSETAGTEASTPTVYVVNYPLKYFAERIGRDFVQVEFPAPPDVDPAFWMPNVNAILGYQQADLILANGATYAKWINRVSLPESRMVFTSDAFTDRLIRVEGELTHTHGPTGEHSHEGVAFTTWLDPTLAVEQAAAVRDAFSVEWPEHAREFDGRFIELESDLAELDTLLSEMVGSSPQVPLLASHPVYQYLSRRYNLDLLSVQWEPEESPTEAMWLQLGSILREHPANWMLWESTPLSETADRLGELGVEVIVFDQCANSPEAGDYLSVMRENAENLATAFGR